VCVWQAFAFSERTHPGPEVYVIVRVGRLGAPEPTYIVYTDPHQALSLGRLQCVSEIYLQRNPASPV
jgi:hypothetical protein